MTVEADRLARILGPAWESMGYGTLAARARQLERAASFARMLGRYMDETDTVTAGEALERLQASPLHRHAESAS